MYYPGIDFREQTEDQIALRMEAVNAREGRELARSGAAMGGLEDVSTALPSWHGHNQASVEPLDFSVSAQRGMVEAVGRGLIVGDAWRQIVPVWENLLAASGELDAWREKQRKAKGGR